VQYLLDTVQADRSVRQALNYALDVPELIETAMKGAGRVLNGPLTPYHLGYNPSTPPYGYAPERAKMLLREAGYGDGMRVVLDVPTILPDRAPALARQMAEHYSKVGIVAEVREFPDRPAYADMVRAKEIDDACCFDSSPLSTYRGLGEKFHSGVHGPWWQGYENPQGDQLLDRAAATPEGARRQELYRQAYRTI
jgi:peptide/nickel transport system substrate-binding protein